MSNLYIALFGWMALVTLIALALWLTLFLCSLPWKKSSEAERKQLEGEK